MIEISNFSIRYGRKEALHECSLVIHKGEVLGVLGPNGSGKTTLVKAITGLILPESKDNRFFVRKNPSCFPGVVLEAPGLFMNSTVLWNLNYYKVLRGASQQKVNESISITKIHDFLKVKCSKLSFGTRQRVAWARALLSSSDYYIFDDPTIGLDPHGIRDLRELLFSMKNQGKGVLVTSHNLSEMEKVCDRVLFLNNGTTCLYDHVKSIISNYGSLENAYLKVIKTNEAPSDSRI